MHVDFIRKLLLDIEVPYPEIKQLFDTSRTYQQSFNFLPLENDQADDTPEAQVGCFRILLISLPWC